MLPVHRFEKNKKTSQISLLRKPVYKLVDTLGADPLIVTLAAADADEAAIDVMLQICAYTFLSVETIQLTTAIPESSSPYTTAVTTETMTANTTKTGLIVVITEYIIMFLPSK